MLYKYRTESQCWPMVLLEIELAQHVLRRWLTGHA